MSSPTRRHFLRASALASLSPLAASCLRAQEPETSSSVAPSTAPPTSQNPVNRNVFGPRAGFTPMMSNLVSMMDWMRNTLLQSLNGLSVADLDAHLDDEANSIGAMLLHLVATERFYQLSTFDGLQYNDFPAAYHERYGVAADLGAPAREQINGHDLDFYLDQLKTIRATTLEQLAERDDEWLLRTDADFGWGPTNNYCKWFHECEHESNHNGQIKFLRKRVA